MNERDTKEFSDEHQTDIDREAMHRINRIFSIAFYLCALPPAIPLIIALGSFVASLITLGVAGADPLSVMSSIIANGAVIAAFIWSYTKEKRGTIAAIAAVTLRWLLYDKSYPEGLIYAAAAIILQSICIIQYEKIDHLKTHEGYPDFYNLSRHDGGKRIMSDEQIKERMGYSQADMDTLKADGSVLQKNEDKHTANIYMDEICTDGTDITKNE